MFDDFKGADEAGFLNRCNFDRNGWLASRIPGFWHLFPLFGINDNRHWTVIN